MSDAGVPRFPQPGQYRPEGQQRAFNSDFRVGNLNRAPNDIRAEITAERRAIRLEGEITRVNQDGSVRVATERGDIDVRLNERLSADERHQQRPQIGQTVELEIQPTPRNAPEQLPQVIIRPAPPEVQSQQAQTQQQPAARITSTPVQVEVRDGQAVQARPEAQIVRPEQIDPNAPPAPNRFPEIGSLVRLEPVAPEQLEQLIQTRQVLVLEVLRQNVTPLPVLDVLPQPQQQPATPLATQTVIQPPALNTVIQVSVSPEILPQPQTQTIQTPLILQPVNASQSIINPAPTQQTQQVSLPLIRSTALNAVFAQIAEPLESQINIPVLTRAQAAVAQLQTVANQVPETPILSFTPQDARIGSIQAPSVVLTTPNTSEAPLQIVKTDASQSLVIGTQKAVQITGTVIAKTNTQVPIVQFSVPQSIGTPFTLTAPSSPVLQQTYALQFPSDALILGSRIDVTPQSLITTNTATTQGSALTSALPVLPYGNIAFPQAWPIMQEIQQTLLQQTAQAAVQTAQAFNAVLPSPSNPAQFGPAALFFVAAIRGGDISSWLGDKATEILRSAGKGDLLSRLTGESLPVSRGDAPVGDWRGMNIPLLWNGDIQQIILHYKHDSQGSDEQDADGNKGTRFIFDLNLDMMGKVQMDGLFRPISRDGPRLDIVLRTEERFSGAMQQEMRRLYMDAIKPSQVGGELSFQDGMDTWVMIEAEDPAALGVSA